MARKPMIRARGALRALVLVGTLAGLAAGGFTQGTGSAAKAAQATPAQDSALTFQGEVTQGGWIRGIAPEGTVSMSLDGEDIGIAPDTHAWLAAFDRNAKSTETLKATLADGTVLTRTIEVSPRNWHIERINVPMHKGTPSAAFMKIRKPELAKIHGARAMHTDAQGWKQHLIWPVKGRISGAFGSQRVYQGVPGAYHSGVDIATGHSGTPFVAPADGVVTFVAAKPFSLEGNLLMIDHGNGLNSAFLHCSAVLVKEGDHVKQGQVIGRIGMTGRATGPHLHWSLMWKKDRVDPVLFTGPMN